MSEPNFPQSFPLYDLLPPAADAAGRSSAFVSLKNFVKAWIVVFINQGNAATVALTPNQATTVAGAGAKVIANARIWTKLDQASADFAAAAEAANFTTDAATKEKLVIFEIDMPKVMDVDGGFDCIRITTGASNAANITSALLIGQPRHAGATIPSPLID
jgi:hypothetical protein